MIENIREKQNKSLPKLLREFVEITNDQLFNGFYSGKVENNNDPQKNGRCQVRVFGVYSNDIPQRDLPWANPDFNFIGSKIGSFIVPPNDAIVNVYFDNGDIYKPRYTTKVFEKNKLPSDKDTDYPDTMIFFETDAGDKLVLNRRKGNVKFTHRSGSSLTIDSAGNVKIHHTAFLQDDGSTAIPTGQGPFCGLPNCIVFGTPQAAQRCAPGV